MRQLHPIRTHVNKDGLRMILLLSAAALSFQQENKIALLLTEVKEKNRKRFSRQVVNDNDIKTLISAESSLLVKSPEPATNTNKLKI